MVTRALRQASGAHYGWRDWLAQRITAIVMALYTVLLLAVCLWNGGINYPLWKTMFASGVFKLATFVFMLALCSIVPLATPAMGQAKPFPGPDVQQIYERLLPQIEKIPAFDHHAHPGYADDRAYFM